MATKSTDVEHSRIHRHSADRDRGQGRPVHHRDILAVYPASVAAPRSPSPIQSSKHHRLKDSKERGRPTDSYVMKYQKYQQPAYSPGGLTELQKAIDVKIVLLTF